MMQNGMEMLSAASTLAGQQQAVAVAVAAAAAAAAASQSPGDNIIKALLPVVVVKIKIWNLSWITIDLKNQCVGNLFTFKLYMLTL